MFSWGYKNEWADGTSHLLFEPLELLEKLAALPAPPHQPRALILAPHARWRSRAVAYEGPGVSPEKLPLDLEWTAYLARALAARLARGTSLRLTFSCPAPPLQKRA